MGSALPVSLAEEQAQSRSGVVGDTALLLSCSLQHSVASLHVLQASRNSLVGSILDRRG